MNRVVPTSLLRCIYNCCSIATINKCSQHKTHKIPTVTRAETNRVSLFTTFCVEKKPRGTKNTNNGIRILSYCYPRSFGEWGNGTRFKMHTRTPFDNLSFAVACSHKTWFKTETSVRKTLFWSQSGCGVYTSVIDRCLIFQLGCNYRHLNLCIHQQRPKGLSMIHGYQSCWWLSSHRQPCKLQPLTIGDQ